MARSKIKFIPNDSLPDFCVVKNFTDRLQEAFLLRAIGLQNKEGARAMGNCTEDAFEKLAERSLHFFTYPDGSHSIEAAIAIATRTGLTAALCNKFRAKHADHIRRYESMQVKANITNLPGWKSPE